MRNTFKDNGSYSPVSGEADDLAQKPQAEIRFDPASVPDLADFQPGDEAMLHIRIRIGSSGTEGEEGMPSHEVIQLTADAMDQGARTERQRSKQSAGMGSMGVQDEDDL